MTAQDNSVYIFLYSDRLKIFFFNNLIADFFKILNKISWFVYFYVFLINYVKELNFY